MEAWAVAGKPGPSGYCRAVSYTHLLIHRGRELAEAILAEDPKLESAKYRPRRFLLENGEEKRVTG